jgi:hypothetical protein
MQPVSIFCAVWHKDPNRHALLKAHWDNLRRQTLPVHPIYIFDGGERPPGWLDAESVTAQAPLSIYQAWNLGLALVRTPLVMNLNLDDRLAPDAVAQMAAGLERDRAMLIGGDWRICYSQEDTEAVTPCFPATEWPHDPAWPPVPGTRTRLGSGTVAHGTFGPSTLWRIDVHQKIPRYPWRFADGSSIGVIGDVLFWMAMQHFGLKLARLPMVIGNYHSHPSEQAEFRHKGEEAKAQAGPIPLI